MFVEDFSYLKDPDTWYIPKESESMSKIYIYLAGPITGCTDGEANDWRATVSAVLGEINPSFVGVSPLRCEPIKGERYEPEYEDNQFGTPQVIAAKNKMDVRRCDITLAYIAEEQPASVGTLQEIGWACGMDKPVILVTDNEYVRNNAVIQATVPWRFPASPDGMEKAIQVIAGLYEVYA